MWRWVQAYAPEIRKRLRRWMYLFRAVHNHGQTLISIYRRAEIEKPPNGSYKAALANPDNRPPHVLSIDGNRSYPAAIGSLKAGGELRLA